MQMNTLLKCLTVLFSCTITDMCRAQENSQTPLSALPSSPILSPDAFIRLVGPVKYQQLQDLAATKNGEPMTPDEVKAILGEAKFVEFSKVVDDWTRKQAEQAESPEKEKHSHFVQILKERRLEENVGSLHVRVDIDEDLYLLASSGSVSRDRIGAGRIEAITCLTDKRVARIYEHVEQLPPEKANLKCQEIFEQNLKGLNMGLETWFGLADLPPAERKPIGRHDHAMRSAVLLSAIFCDGQTLLSQIDRWKTRNLLFKGRALLRTEHQGSALDFVTRYGEPDQLFLAHLMMINLQQQGKLTPEVLAEAHRLGLPEERIVSMIKWDAPCVIYDRSGAVALKEDDPRLEGNFTVTHYWGARAYNSLDVQDTVVAYLRGVISQPANTPRDPQPTPVEPKN